VGGSDPEAARDEILERWERAAPGWGKRAEHVRAFGMPVSAWMVEHAGLRPGMRVLELAAGPGDTGFLAAELIEPGGTLVCSDASDTMLQIARARARELGIADMVEFKRVELEWIDLGTASVDAVLCKWGLMFSVDPETSLREARRVLRPGGRIALAVWDQPEFNPWSTITTDALVELGYTEPTDRDAPGQFALAKPGRLAEVMAAAGFVDVVIETVDPSRAWGSVDEWVEETNDLSSVFGEVYEPLSADQREAVRQKIAALAKPYTGADGWIRPPARSLVAAADA
jgi:SAM-dependent methyltransferase